MIQRIESQYNEYLSSFGEPPRFLITDPATFSDLIYEVTKNMKISEEDKLIYELNEYLGMIIAITISQNFQGIEVR